jgi:hypothetical protein
MAAFMSEFAPMHPGGFKIIRSYAGMDATVAYKTVLHDVNPEVDAMLAMYEIGMVRRLRLEGWGVAIGEGGLRVVTSQDLYRGWVRLLYAAVEMENAVTNDYGIRDEPVTHDEMEAGPRQSPYKTQLLFQAHLRFLDDYLAELTGPTLEKLWRFNTAMDGTEKGADEMRSRLSVIRQGADATASKRLDERFSAALRKRTQLEWCVEACRRIEAADKTCLAELKSSLRRGVQVFERLEREALKVGASELVAAIGDVPQALERYFRALAAVESAQ